MARRGALPAVVASDEEVRTTFSRVRASVSRFGDSDDVVQEAFTRAVRQQVPGNLEPWLRTVARRIAIDNARRRHEIAAGDAVAIDGMRAPSVPTPEDVVVANESVGLIRKAIRSLPSRYRDALVTYSEHRDNTAVARRLGVSPNAAGSLLCRARMRLREELDRVGYAAGAVLVRLNRWTDVATTATAAACFVAVMSGPLSATPGAAPTSIAPVPPGSGQTVAAQEVATSRSVRVAREPRRRAPEAAPVDDLTKQVEIVRYELEGCTSGRRAPTPHVALVRNGRRSLTAVVAGRLPHVSALVTGTCRDEAHQRGRRR